MEPATRKLCQDCQPFNQAVELLMEGARRDLAGEGLDPARASFVLELDMLYGGQFHVKRTLSPLLFLRGEGDAQAEAVPFHGSFASSRITEQRVFSSRRSAEGSQVLFSNARNAAIASERMTIEGRAFRSMATASSVVAACPDVSR